MKIEAPRQLEATATRRIARRSGSAASSAFQVEAGDEERGVARSAPKAAIGAVDSLLALQAVPESTEGRRRAVKRAGSMLDMLDEIRLSLLEGRVPRGKLAGLLRIVQSQRDDIADPALNQVLDEIELRAQVELAKYAAHL